MGKQVNYYMSEKDEVDFLNRHGNVNGVLVLLNTYAIGGERELTELPSATDDAYARNLSLVRTEDQIDVVAKPVLEHNVMCIDITNSPVVQFNRCRMFNGRLMSGRLWFDEKGNDGFKSDAFRIWANGLLRWVRANYSRRSTDGWYIGPNAFQLEQTGLLQVGPTLR